MIENTIFNLVKNDHLVVGNLSEQEFIAKVKEIADDDIDGSNVKQARIFATQMYHYCHKHNKQYEVFKRSDFGEILSFCV